MKHQAGRAKLNKNQTGERMMCAVFPCALVWCDRYHERDGDYAVLARLPYHTLELTIEADCPADLRVAIAAEAQKVQGRRGQRFALDSCGASSAMLGAPL